MSEPTPVLPPGPYRAMDSALFLGPAVFQQDTPNLLLGMITGISYREHNTLLLRRPLCRAPRLSQQILEYRDKMDPPALGLGWFFRDVEGWGYGLYFENLTVLRSEEELNIAQTLVDDIAVVQFTKKVDVTEIISKLVGTVQTPP